MAPGQAAARSRSRTSGSSGSGNTGATNVGRALGRRYFFLVLN